MDYIFIAVDRNAHINGVSEISGIRTNGQLGQLNPKYIRGAFTSMVNKNLPSIVNALKDKLNVDDDKFVVVSLNGELIRSVLKKELNEILLPNRIWIDINQLAWPLLINGQITHRTIDALAEYFKLKVSRNPDSADDCATLAQIYGQMILRYKTALSGEETIREIGGDTLEGIRRVFGF